MDNGDLKELETQRETASVEEKPVMVGSNESQVNADELQAEKPAPMDANPPLDANEQETGPKSRWKMLRKKFTGPRPAPYVNNRNPGSSANPERENQVVIFNGITFQNCNIHNIFIGEDALRILRGEH